MKLTSRAYLCVVLFSVFLTLFGCSDKVAEERARKQQKLEECMHGSQNLAMSSLSIMRRRLDCENAIQAAQTQPDSTQAMYNAELCIRSADDIKRQQLEDEERCVKLYK